MPLRMFDFTKFSRFSFSSFSFSFFFFGISFKVQSSLYLKGKTWIRIWWQFEDTMRFKATVTIICYTRLSDILSLLKSYVCKWLLFKMESLLIAFRRHQISIWWTSDDIFVVEWMKRNIYFIYSAELIRWRLHWNANTRNDAYENARIIRIKHISNDASFEAKTIDHWPYTSIITCYILLCMLCESLWGISYERT